MLRVLDVQSNRLLNLTYGGSWSIAIVSAPWLDGSWLVSVDPPPQPTKKEILAGQMKELEFKWQQLLKEEKYELLQELKEIYEKIKKDYDNL